MDRIPSSFLHSAYSTCRALGLCFFVSVKVSAEAERVWGYSSNYRVDFRVWFRESFRRCGCSQISDNGRIYFESRVHPEFIRNPHLILFWIGLYTILASPIVYGVWHTKEGGSVGGVYCAMVVQQYCDRVTVAGGRGQERDDRLPL